jgi:hypothetical protein
MSVKYSSLVVVPIVVSLSMARVARLIFKIRILMPPDERVWSLDVPPLRIYSFPIRREFASFSLFKLPNQNDFRSEGFVILYHMRTKLVYPLLGLNSIDEDSAPIHKRLVEGLTIKLSA